MECRENCGACCIAPSITSLDKPAGVHCQHLDKNMRCSLFGSSKRPKACADFQPEYSVCGDTRAQALNIITNLEEETSPT